MTATQQNRRMRRKVIICELKQKRAVAYPVVFGAGCMHEYDESAFNESRHAIKVHEEAERGIKLLLRRLTLVNTQLGLPKKSESPRTP